MTYGHCTHSPLIYSLSVPHSLSLSCVLRDFHYYLQVSQQRTFFECNKYGYYEGAPVSQISG